MPRNTRRLPSVFLFLLASTSLTPAWAEVKSVTLTTSGLSEVVENTEGSSEVLLSVGIDQVSDILQSLTILGDTAESASLRVESASAVDHIAKALPFDPARAGDLDHLLASFPGANVSVAMWDETHRGQIVGLAPSCVTAENCDNLLLLREESGSLLRIPLAADMQVTFLDAEVQNMIDRGLAAHMRDASGQMRSLRLAVKAPEGAALEDIQFSYVVPSPAWKTSWRAQMRPDGNVDLQAWAVIENASGRDWDKVDLTLTTGAPKTLQAELYASDWREREVMGQDVVKPVPFAREMQMAKDEAGFAETAMHAMAPMAPDIQATETMAEARYSFPDPVSVKSGEVLSLPFLGETVDARKVSRYLGRGDQIVAHPDLSLAITNGGNVRLPGGIVTLLESGQYVGDAELPDIQPGETRSVAIAKDLKVSVNESQDYSDGEVRLSLEDGVLTVIETNRRETVYSVSGPEREDRLLMIDHPALDGWDVESTEGAAAGTQVTEDDQNLLRHEIDLKAGTTVTLRIVERQPVSTTWALTDLSSEQLEIWQGGDISEQDRAALKKVIDLRHQHAEVQAKRDDLAETRNKMVEDQQRAMNFMLSLPDTDPTVDAFRTKILGIEEELAKIDAQDAELKAAIEVLQEELDTGRGHGQ